MSQVEEIRLLPVLPIKNAVLYPNLLMPLVAGRRQSILAAEAAGDSEDETLLGVAQKDATVEEPQLSDLFRVGTQAVIKRLERSDTAIQMVVQGTRRLE